MDCFAEPVMGGRLAATRWLAMTRIVRATNARTKKGGPTGPPFSFHFRRSSAVAADHRADRVVGAEIVGAVDIEQGRKLRARAVDAALDGADGTAADRRGVLVGEAGGADQDQRFALVLRQLVERQAKLLELQMRVLRRLGLQGFGIIALCVLDLAPPLAIVGAEQVAQDGEQPGRQVRARLERVDIGNRAQQRLLNQVVGTIAITGERVRERAPSRYPRHDVVTYTVAAPHSSLPSSFTV